jgi:hypothetical protein
MMEVNEEDDMQTARVTNSMPLIDATMYRPGAPLACVIVLVPILGAIGLTLARFVGRVSIPLWAAFALAGWIALTPLFWLALKTIRVTALTIATGRSWREWKEIAWSDISRVEWRGARIHILGANGAALTFAPRLLHENRELRQYITNRVAPRVIAAPLVASTDAGSDRPVILRPFGVSATELRARPAPGPRLGALTLFALAAGAGALAFLELRAPWGLILLIVCAVIAIVALISLAWLSQVVNLTAEGISVKGFPFSSGRLLPWRDVEFVEVSPNERTLRLRGAHKLRCPGPRLFAQPARDTYRALLHTYCLDRGVPAMRHPGMW